MKEMNRKILFPLKCLAAVLLSPLLVMRYEAELLD